MTVVPKSKDMWAILHLPSGRWDHGDSNETLFWAEYQAWRAIRQYGFDGDESAVWKPIKVKVTIA